MFLFVILTLSQLLVSIVNFVGKPLSEISSDVLMYSHYGWYIANGAIPYVNFWDPKAPLTHEFSALLALLSGGNMFVLYLLGLIAAGTASVLTAYFSGKLVYKNTDENWHAGLFTGIGIYTFVGLHEVGAMGYRPKIFATLMGVLSLYLIITNYPLVAGVVSAFSAAFWQIGIIFPLLVVGIALTNHGRREFTRAVLGGILATIIVVSPFIFLWDLEALIGGAVFAPLTSPDSMTTIAVLVNIFKTVNFLKYSIIFLLVAIIGALSLGQANPRNNWWMITGIVFFVFQFMFIDLDSYPDLLLGFPFFVIVCGHYYACWSGNIQRVSNILVVTFLIVSVVFSGGFGLTFSPMEDSRSVNVLDEPLSNSIAFSLGEILGMDPQNNENIEQAKAVGGSNINNTAVAGDIPPPHEIYWKKDPPNQCLYWVNKEAIGYFRNSKSSPTDTTCKYYIFD